MEICIGFDGFLHRYVKGGIVHFMDQFNVWMWGWRFGSCWLFRDGARGGGGLLPASRFGFDGRRRTLGCTRWRACVGVYKPLRGGGWIAKIETEG